MPLTSGGPAQTVTPNVSGVSDGSSVAYLTRDSGGVINGIKDSGGTTLALPRAAGPRHGLMRWQGLPVNLFTSAVALAANQWFGATFRSPVPVMAARIALRVRTADLAAASAVASAFCQPLPSALPTAWPFQFDAGDGSGAVNVHQAGSTGQFTFNGTAASIDDSAYPSATGGAATTWSSVAGSTLSTGASVGLFWSDWLNMKVAPIKATDGFYYYGVAVQNSATNTIPGFAGTAGKLKALLSDPTYANAQSIVLTDTYPLTNSGDFATWAVTTAQSLARASSGYFESPPVEAIEFLTTARALNVAALADSQLAGFSTGITGATVESFGAIARACAALSTAAAPVQYVNTAMPAADFPTWMQTWLAGLEQISPNAAGRGQSSLITGVWKPDVCFIQTSSGNDNASAPTAVTVRSGFGKALRLAELCRRNNIVPVLCTVPPASGRYSVTTSGGDMTVEAARRQINTMMRTAAASGAMLLLDTDLVVANNSATPSTIIGAFDGGDGVHFSDAGNTAIAAAAQAVLRLIV